MASANDKSQRFQSNEEVIEELTKDLESSCIRADDSSDANARSKNTIGGDSWDVMDKECNKDSNDNAQDTEKDVDEELLKDRDLLLTESEQEVCFCIGCLFCNLLQLFSVRCDLFTFAGIEM